MSKVQACMLFTLTESFDHEVVCIRLNWWAACIHMITIKGNHKHLLRQIHHHQNKGFGTYLIDHMALHAIIMHKCLAHYWFSHTHDL